MAESVFNGLFAALLARALIIGVDAGNQTLDASAYKDNDAFQVTGADTTGRTVTVPQLRRISIWQADAENDHQVTLKRGTGSVSIEPGQRITLVTDGSANGIAGALLTGPASTSAWQEIDDTDSPFSAVAGNRLDVDTSTAVVTVTLPADPSKYDEIWFRNSADSFATHSLTVARNGETIMGLAQNMTVNTNGAYFSLWFDGATWQLSLGGNE